MSDKTALGDRMKRYEVISQIYLTPRMPIICRIDGKAFHTYTRGLEKPWDENLQTAMTNAAKALMSKVQGAEVAYIQSDEISVLLNPYKYFETQVYFDGNIQKIASVTASIATQSFNNSFTSWNDRRALFDSRCFVVPREEAVNYFIWRQQDAIRNSISGYAQANFSHKELQKKSTKEMLEMLSLKNISWEDSIQSKNKYGWCVFRKPFKKIVDDKEITRTELFVDHQLPRFSLNRSYFDSFLQQVEE